MKIQSYWRQ